VTVAYLATRTSSSRDEPGSGVFQKSIRSTRCFKDDTQSAEVGEYADQSSAVKAAVDMYGATELMDPNFVGTSLIALLAHVLDSGRSAASLRSARSLRMRRMARSITFAPQSR
jgi:hypothetical protein